jgi:hypothetical protein
MDQYIHAATRHVSLALSVQCAQRQALPMSHGVPSACTLSFYNPSATHEGACTRRLLICYGR